MTISSSGTSSSPLLVVTLVLLMASATVHGQGFPAFFDLASVNGSNGFAMYGVAADDRAGSSLGSGDFNGDGLTDVVIGAPDANGTAGEVYVVFGTQTPITSTVDLALLDGSNGFTVNGVDAVDRTGDAVGSADINDDGIDDLIIGVPGGDPDGYWDDGEIYVIFGRDTGFPATIDPATLPTDERLLLIGPHADGGSSGTLGRAVRWAGDVNDDGVDDLVVGARLASPAGASHSGASFVVFGSDALPAEIELGNLDGTDGFSITGEGAGDNSGYAVSGVGDVNGDLIDDLLIGAPYANGPPGDSDGAAYVIFGSATTFSATINLSSLNSGVGVELSTAASVSACGRSVSRAGDVNGDGLGDLLIGAPTADASLDGPENVGYAHVVYGSDDGLPSGVPVAFYEGFYFEGIEANDSVGTSLADAGDVNGDGVDDIIIGTNRDEAYVVFGDDRTNTAAMTVDDLDGSVPGSDGFVVGRTVTPHTGAGRTVAAAGDFNGDGVADVLVGAPVESVTALAAGGAYVLFGIDTEAPQIIANEKIAVVIDGTPVTVPISASDLELVDAISPPSEVTYSLVGLPGNGEVVLTGRVPLVLGLGSEFTQAQIDAGLLSYEQDLPLMTADTFELVARDAAGNTTAQISVTILTGIYHPSMSLASLDGGNGFAIHGIAAGDRSGVAVAGAGDVNGDGLDDLIIGGDGGNSGTGQAYVVFGNDMGFPTHLELADLDGSNGFAINGIGSGDETGSSVAGAGDVNDDGLDDLIVGAPWASPGGVSSAGSAYVIFGRSSRSAFPPVLELSSLDGSAGFVINGMGTPDLAGTSVQAAGDVNGDHIDDLIIGARGASLHSFGVGRVSVLFGASTPFPATVDLSTLDGTNGFNLKGIDTLDETGTSVGPAGDVNDDGIGDLIMGAPQPDYASPTGRALVVFGSDTGFDPTIELLSLDGSDGFELVAAAPEGMFGRAVSSAGDVNGDQIDDLIVGAPREDGSNGAAYVLFGSDTGFSAAVSTWYEVLHGGGVRIVDVCLNDNSSTGHAVSGGFDFNGDGLADVIVGAPTEGGLGSATGAAYVIFGPATAEDPWLTRQSVNGYYAAEFLGAIHGDSTGEAVSTAGDLNGDGLDDLVIGAPGADPNGEGSGTTYVIFGVDSDFLAIFRDGFEVGDTDAWSATSP